MIFYVAVFIADFSQLGGHFVVLCSFEVNFWFVKFIETKSLTTQWKSTGPRETRGKQGLKIKSKNQNKTSKQVKLAIGLCTILLIS